MMGPDRVPALATQEVSKSFGGVHAVRSVSLQVATGERRAVIGPNGAGKTTFFNLITGELSADHGAIFLFGSDITRRSVQERAKMGLARTYQISQLFLNLTVEQNLFLASVSKDGLTFRLLTPWEKFGEQREWVRHVAGQVGLEEFLGARVGELSHGLQRQLEVGMAIAMRPSIMMLDEPAAGLAPAERSRLSQLIKGLPREITLILIEHDMELVLDIADTITVMNRGEVLAEGAPDEIRANESVQNVYLGTANG